MHIQVWEMPHMGDLVIPLFCKGLISSLAQSLLPGSDAALLLHDNHPVTNLASSTPTAGVT